MERISDQQLHDLLTYWGGEPVKGLSGGGRDTMAATLLPALRELLALREESKWIAVTPETMPDKHHEVLVAVTPDKGGRFSMRAHQRNGDWFDFGGDGEWSLGSYGWTVTHWMEDRPLPAPPTEVEITIRSVEK